jgi:hypothetical protein
MKCSMEGSTGVVLSERRKDERPGVTTTGAPCAMIVCTLWFLAQVGRGCWAVGGGRESVAVGIYYRAECAMRSESHASGSGPVLSRDRPERFYRATSSSLLLTLNPPL